MLLIQGSLTESKSPFGGIWFIDVSLANLVAFLRANTVDVDVMYDMDAPTMPGEYATSIKVSRSVMIDSLITGNKSSDTVVSVMYDPDARRVTFGK